MSETIVPAWIAALKPGDPVVLQSGRLTGRTDCVARVERLTPAQIVVASPYREGGATIRFRRTDGDAVERPYNSYEGRSRIVEATPERLAAIQEAKHRATLMQRIRTTEWKKQTTAVLEAVHAALQSDT